MIIFSVVGVFFFLCLQLTIGEIVAVRSAAIIILALALTLSDFFAFFQLLYYSPQRLINPHISCCICSHIVAAEREKITACPPALQPGSEF